MLSDDRYTLEKKYVPYQEEEEGNVVGACRAIMSSPDEAPLASRCIFPTKASQPTLGFGFQSFGLALQGPFGGACLLVYLCLP